MKVAEIQRFCIHDGPGVRTTVFLKGCSLRCKWCHNPETLELKSEITLDLNRCKSCGLCASCENGVHIFTENGHILKRENCTACKKCEIICPVNAIEIIGKELTVKEVFDTVKKDKAFYGENGGVTLSGGECLLQAEECKELLAECKKEGISTAIETALNVPWKNIETVLPFCDLVFADFKIPDSKKHKEFTGAENTLIAENLKKLTDIGAKVTVRIPLIPTVNDSDEDIKLFADKLCGLADKLCGIEVLRYNNLSESKYRVSGKDFTDFGKRQTDDELKSFCNRLEEALDRKTSVYCLL